MKLKFILRPNTSLQKVLSSLGMGASKCGVCVRVSTNNECTCEHFFFSIYIYGVKISMFNGHQTVDEGEICSYISRDSMSSFCASSSLSVPGLHTFYQMFITYM